MRVRYRALLPSAAGEVVELLKAARRELNAAPDELPAATARARKLLRHAEGRLACPQAHHRQVVADVDD